MQTNNTQELSLRREKCKEYYHKNKEQIRAWSKAHIEANQERYNASSRDYYHKNKEKCSLACKEYAKKHKKELKQKRAERYKKNKAELAKRVSDRYFANHEENKRKAKEKREANKKLRNAKQKERYESDIQYKLINCIRARIYHAIKSTETFRRSNIKQLIGCSYSVLKAHIEKQFEPGMSWNNHSLHGWHIDHIKPVNIFDLTDPEQQKLCFHYTNLRPLWATKNLSRPKNGSDF